MTARAVAVTALFAILAACAVHRQSEQYACTTNRDCKDLRVCAEGYCVERLTTGTCPAPCTSCDLTTMACNVECSAGQPCGDVRCPAGFACTVKCSGGCGAIDCAQASRCTVTCTGAAACGEIQCGSARCVTSCSGLNACSSIDCGASCACDVDCNGSSSCPVPTCPVSCSVATGAGPVCSSMPPGCDRCFSP